MRKRHALGRSKAKRIFRGSAGFIPAILRLCLCVVVSGRNALLPSFDGLP